MRLFYAVSAKQAVRHFGRPGTPLCLYTDQPDVGRIRHLYVLSADRAEGVGRALVLAIILKARQHYRVLRLRTDTQATDAFHRASVLMLWRSPTQTHTLTL